MSPIAPLLTCERPEIGHSEFSGKRQFGVYETEGGSRVNSHSGVSTRNVGYRLRDPTAQSGGMLLRKNMSLSMLQLGVHHKSLDARASNITLCWGMNGIIASSHNAYL